MILGIVPARGGSKRLPGKNIKLLCGKPLIAWTIDVAKQSKYIDRTVVVTEDSEIEYVAKGYCAAEVISRPSRLAQDDSSIYDTIWFTLDMFPEAEWVVLLEPTCPLRNVDDVDEPIRRCLMEAAPSCVGVEQLKPVPNGAVYVGYVSWLREHRNFDGGRTITHQMPPSRSVHIDTQEDWDRAEALIKAQQ